MAFHFCDFLGAYQEHWVISQVKKNIFIARSCSISEAEKLCENFRFD